jgi:hypothetical protein
MGQDHVVVAPSASPFLAACRREPVERTPVWFMRQAGRSLPEYRAIREHHGLFEVVRRPELCAEVTLQPVHRHDVDAAVMFADIMLPVLGMGVEVELVENVGPVVARPVRELADVERLAVPEPEEAVPWVLASVRLVREALRDDQAVVGFARLTDPELAAWIDTSVIFPNCMVDRITPSTTDADREAVHREFGIEDAWPVPAEPFTQWIVEDHFPLVRAGPDDSS